MTTQTRIPVGMKVGEAALMRIAEIAVEHSGGRLRLAQNEEDESIVSTLEAGTFLKVDGTRVGRDIEVYVIMGAMPNGWMHTLTYFLQEVVMPLKKDFPESYAEASEALRILGESVYPKEMLPAWNAIFKA